MLRNEDWPLYLVFLTKDVHFGLLPDGIGWLFANDGGGARLGENWSISVDSVTEESSIIRQSCFSSLCFVSEACFACFWQRSASFACRNQLNRKVVYAWLVQLRSKSKAKHDRQLIRCFVCAWKCQKLFPAQFPAFSYHVPDKSRLKNWYFCLSIAIFCEGSLWDDAHTAKYQISQWIFTRVALISRSTRTRLMRIQFPNTNLFKVFNLSSLPTIDFFELRIGNIRPFYSSEETFWFSVGTFLTFVRLHLFSWRWFMVKRRIENYQEDSSKLID